MKSPEISVVMPVYNHEAYVAEAIASVLGQDFADFELIIVNDGSTDASEDVVLGFDDPRIHYFSQANRGAHHALDRGIANARGRFVAILNSDDVYAPKRLSLLREVALREGRRFLISDIALIDAKSRVMGDPDHWFNRWYGQLKSGFVLAPNPAAALLRGNVAITSSNFFMERTLAQSLGGFRPYRYILDYDYAFRAARACGSEGFGFMRDAPLLRYRLHGSNTIAEHPLKANLETAHFLERAIAEEFGDALTAPLGHLRRIRRHIVQLATLARQRDASASSGESRARPDRGDTHPTLKHAGITQENLRRLVTRLQTDLDASRRDMAVLRRSRSYRLGHALLQPLRWLHALRPTPAQRRQFRTSSVAEVRQVLSQVLDTVSLVSFDIFDTLLERVIDPPDEVKRIVARRSSIMLRDRYGLEVGEDTLLALRHEVEWALRGAAANAGMDHECKFSDIARDMAMRLHREQQVELAAALVDVEIAVENEVLRVKPEMADLLAWLNRRGVRVVAISDMYLDRAHLQTIFQSMGLHAHVDDIYVSSEVGVGKYSGRLFRLVLQVEGIEPARVIHIGDNAHSDARAPRRLGIRSIHLDDRVSNRRRQTLRAYARLAARNPYWRGRALLQMVEPPAAEGNFFYRYGYQILGPIFSTFMLGALEELRRRNVQKVYFLAREGELFMRLFERMAHVVFGEGARPEAHYLYVSRKSAATPSAHAGLDYQSAIVPLFNPKQKGLTSICNAFGLPAAAFTEVSRRHGYSGVDAPIHDWRSDQFKGMLADPDFQALVRTHAAGAWELLHDYLAQEGFFSADRVALVDIGWNGSIQKFMQEAFAADANSPHVTGVYLGFLGGIRHDFDEKKNAIVGVMADERGKLRPQDVFSRFEEIFEEGARALHATTLGYARNPDTGNVEPVLKAESAPDRIAEVRSNAHIAEFQRGILDFAPRFIEALDLTTYGFADIKPFVLDMAQRAVVFPTRNEADQLMQLAHSEDFGFESVMDFNSERLAGWHAVLRPRRLWRRLRAANWKYGTARLLGLPGLNALVRLADYRKIGH